MCRIKALCMIRLQQGWRWKVQLLSTGGFYSWQKITVPPKQRIWVTGQKSAASPGILSRVNSEERFSSHSCPLQKLVDLAAPYVSIHLPGYVVPRGTCAGSPFPLNQAMSQLPAHQLWRGSRILQVLLLLVLWVVFSLTDVSSLSPEEIALINTYMMCHISWISMQQNTFSTLQIVFHRQPEHLNIYI